MLNHTEYKWPFGLGTNRYAIVPYTQIAEKTPNIPGLYIWLIRPSNGEQAKECANLINQVQLKASIKGNIRLEYFGELNKIIDVDSAFAQSDELIDDIASNVFFAAGYPLYIGISKNLASRLKNHQEQFTEARLNHGKEKINTFKNTVEQDSDEESEYFGARLASMWPDSLEEVNLYVKLVTSYRCAEETSCVTCGRGCAQEVKSAFRKCETLANSIFNPVFGRR